MILLLCHSMPTHNDYNLHSGSHNNNDREVFRLRECTGYVLRLGFEQANLIRISNTELDDEMIQSQLLIKTD